MSTPLPHVLSLVEGVTRQRAALVIDADEVPSVADALDLFRCPPEALIERGQLPSDAVVPFLEMGECLFVITHDGALGDPHEWLRLAQGHELITMDGPLQFERRALDGSGHEVMLAELTVDRREIPYDRDWPAFHKRKLGQFENEIETFLFESASSFVGERKASEAMSSRTEEDKALLLEAASKRIFNAPFELYSRFVGQRRLIKDGLSTLRNIMCGHGGACSEKAQAVRILADALEIPASYVLSGPNTRGEVPVEALLEILETFEAQFSSKAQAFWNHIAVLVELGGREILVDASNGNIPYLWVSGDELEAMLDREGPQRKGVAHRYVVGADELFYHRVDQLVPERLLYALELGWADPHIDIVQVLDDELGLLTMPDLWLGVLAYRDDDERQTLRSWYHDQWLTPGHVRGVLFAKDLETAEGPLASELRDRYPEAASAATAGRAFIEERLEEANPGANYRIELVVVGRRQNDS